MLDKSFKNINLLERSLNGSWLRNEVVSNNIANVNTPNFKRQEVKFEEYLSESISNLSIEARTTNSKHIQINGGSKNQPVVVTDSNSKVRKDGNNVNIDVEMARLAKNSLYYNTVSQRVSSYFNKLRLVTKDGR